jgi:ethanolamine ammonia-lyase large subunit
VIPYESDEVTRLIIDSHDAAAFAPVAGLTVGEFRDWLLDDATDEALAALAPGLTPEMVAAVSKLMRNQDLILVARKCRVVTALPQHHRPARAAGGAPAAQPPDRRPAGHRRLACSTACCTASAMR